MSKKQLLLLMLLPLIAGILLTVVVAFGLINAAENTSGVLYIVGLIAGLLPLAMVVGYGITIASYPAEGFAALAPPAPTSPSKGNTEDDELDDEGDFDDDGFEDDDFDNDDEFSGDASDSYDGGSDLYEEADEFGDEFEDDDELW